MKTLILWGDGGVEVARARHEEGASLLLWDGERSAALDAAAIPYRSASSLTASRNPSTYAVPSPIFPPRERRCTRGSRSALVLTRAPVPSGEASSTISTS